jgi:hypothetical protein
MESEGANHGLAFHTESMDRLPIRRNNEHSNMTLDPYQGVSANNGGNFRTLARADSGSSIDSRL